MFFTSNKIEKFKTLPTPFYYYNTEVLTLTAKKCMEAANIISADIHYALKANHQDKIIQILSKHGIGADCVSKGEVEKAIKNKINPKKIVLAGVGKTDEEITYALQKDIASINAESIQELEIINNIASQLNVKANISIRINPNVDAYTHKYITTGLEENKFGINASDLPHILEKISTLKNIKLIGTHYHIGSQITDMSVFKTLCLKVNEIHRYLSDKKIKIEHINLGGGLGVNYTNPDEHLTPDFHSYFDVFNKFLEKYKYQQLHFELGRALVAQCGALIAKVIIVKKSFNKQFLIIDTGMNHLIRPALYEAFHLIQNLSKTDTQTSSLYDVCGPICETTDFFGKNVWLQHSERNDIIAIRTTGAYGEVMSSDYNLRGKPNIIFSDEL